MSDQETAPYRRVLARRRAHDCLASPRSRQVHRFETYVRFAQAAERGKFDLIFFGEGLVVREHHGNSSARSSTGGPTPSRCCRRWRR